MKRIVLLIIMAATCVALKSEKIKQLQLTLEDGALYSIILKGNIIMTPIENEILEIQSPDELRQIPIKNIKTVRLTYGTSTSVNEILNDNSGQWSIFSLTGALVLSGVGVPDFSSLNRGEIYIVSQGPVTYKLLLR